MTSGATRSIATHAHAWLFAANLVGVLLSLLLIAPGLNTALGPLTYGRWVPVHLQWNLYGWCALPVVGALFAWYAGSDSAFTPALRRALAVWSGALALGAVAWLGGSSSGKLFIDWSGWARGLFPFAAAWLWCTLARIWWRRRQESKEPWSDRARGLVLGALVLVAPLMYWSAGSRVYPSVNPDSGGATGGSLFGSTLVVVGLIGALPVALRHPPRGAVARIRRWYWFIFAGECLFFLSLDHGDASHHSLVQIIALGLTLPWAWLVAPYYSSFAWPSSARPWLASGWGWWVLLLVTGWITFLPGVSERLKFTHLLVAHSHLAMAGALTSFGMIILTCLGHAPRGGRGAFWLWQAALGIHLGALVALGIHENRDLAAFYAGDAFVQTMFGIRLVAGIAMTVASGFWLLPHSK